MVILSATSLACTLDAPHASKPSHKSEVTVYEFRPRPTGGLMKHRISASDLELCTPTPDAWDLDTVRMVFWRLYEFFDDVPANRPDPATVTASVKMFKTKHDVVFTLETGTMGVSTRVGFYVLDPSTVQRYEHLDGAVVAPLVDALASLPAQWCLASMASPAWKVKDDSEDEPPTSNPMKILHDLSKVDPDHFEYVLMIAKRYLKLADDDDEAA